MKIEIERVSNGFIFNQVTAGDTTVRVIQDTVDTDGESTGKALEQLLEMIAEEYGCFDKVKFIKREEQECTQHKFKFGVCTNCGELEIKAITTGVENEKENDSTSSIKYNRITTMGAEPSVNDDNRGL
jgi:hypothetical protein